MEVEVVAKLTHENFRRGDFWNQPAKRFGAILSATGRELREIRGA